MPNLLDALYALALMGVSPWLLWQRWRYGKYRRGMWQKLTGSLPPRREPGPCLWLHAVSVGEVLLLRPFLAQLRRQYPHWQVYLTVGTESGLEMARRHFPDLLTTFAPADFTWAIRQAFDRIRPDLILLTEVELWPNWLAEARRRQVPVAVINGRLSPRSFHRYRWLGRAFARYTAAIRLWAMQNQLYAERLRQLHIPAERIAVTGSMKFDGLNRAGITTQTRTLAELFGLSQPGDPGKTELVWVAGSTQEPEERIVLDVYRSLLKRFPGVRLILVPRHPERCPELARWMESSGWTVIRRSTLGQTTERSHSLDPACPGNSPQPSPPVILVDTLGELIHVWGLADVAFVGGSFGNRGGQNMLEPAALGVAVVFGPNVWNFQDVAEQLCHHRAARQVFSPQELEAALSELLSTPHLRQEIGHRARQFVQTQQGAVLRTLTALQPLLDHSTARAQAA
jgi:3-deoxy-D-manno-octulosonic-acid transferase